MSESERLAQIRFVWHGKATDAETTEAHAGRDIWFLLDTIATLTAEVERLRGAAQAHLDAMEKHNSKYAPGPPPWPVPTGSVADTSRNLADALAAQPKEAR